MKATRCGVIAAAAALCLTAPAPAMAAAARTVVGKRAAVAVRDAARGNLKGFCGLTGTIFYDNGGRSVHTNTLSTCEGDLFGFGGFTRTGLRRDMKWAEAHLGALSVSADGPPTGTYDATIKAGDAEMQEQFSRAKGGGYLMTQLTFFRSSGDGVQATYVGV